MASDRIKLQDEISTQFEKGGVLTATDEKLQEYLMSLASGHVPNDMVRHREIIRALTINYIQMKRHIDGLNRRNSFTQYCVIVLTVMSLLGTAVQAIIAIRTEIRATTSTVPQQQTIEPKITKPQNDTGVNPVQSKPAQQNHQATPKNGPYK